MHAKDCQRDRQRNSSCKCRVSLSSSTAGRRLYTGSTSPNMILCRRSRMRHYDGLAPTPPRRCRRSVRSRERTFLRSKCSPGAVSFISFTVGFFNSGKASDGRGKKRKAASNPLVAAAVYIKYRKRGLEASIAFIFSRVNTTAARWRIFAPAELATPGIRDKRF